MRYRDLGCIGTWACNKKSSGRYDARKRKESVVEIQRI